jgi:hypothetical protein
MENRRRYIRYNNEENQVVTFKKGEQVFSALLENESHNSLSVIYIGQKELSKGDILIWLEGEKVSTKVKVIRNQELSENVFKLALQIVH